MEADDIKQINAALAKVGDELKAYTEQCEAQMAKRGEMEKETRAKVDELLMKQGELQQSLKEINERQAEVEQIVAGRKNGKDGDSRPKSAGELVAEHLEEVGVTSSARAAYRVNVPRAAITTFNGDGQNLVYQDQRPGINLMPLRGMAIRDLVAPGTTTSNSIEYVKETGWTNNAAIVSENPAQSKPYSDIQFELETAAVRTIAHMFKASRQILDDLPALRSIIDSRARYGLQFVEEAQLLYGNGTGMNLHGLVPQAEAFVPASNVLVAHEQRIDRVRLAMLQVNLAEYPASGVVLHPTDWAAIELTKDQEGRYIVGQPQGSLTPTLWNMPVVSTQAIAAGEFLVGAFALASQVFDRMGIEILVSTENADDFEKNMVSIRAEERLAFAVYRPEAFVTGSLVASSST